MKNTKMPSIPERQIQSNFFKEIILRNWQCNKIFAFAVKNEVGKNNIVAGALNKQAGVIKGVSDVVILDFQGSKLPLFLEFKKPKQKQTESQKDFESLITSKGYTYAVVYSTAEAINETVKYFELYV